MTQAEHTFDELKGKTVAQLREIAEGIEDLTGYTQMNKDHLLEAICNHLHIDMHAHHEIVGIDKRAMKGQIKELKAQRDAALAAHDHAALKVARRKIHRIKRRMRNAMQ